MFGLWLWKRSIRLVRKTWGNGGKFLTNERNITHPLANTYRTFIVCWVMQFTENHNFKGHRHKVFAALVQISELIPGTQVKGQCSSAPLHPQSGGR